MPRKFSRSQEQIENPFTYLATNISTGDDDEVYKEKPVGIQEFIESKEFLNLKWNPEKMIGCRPKIMEIAIKLADPNVREAILLLGKGSGKDFVSSLFHLYGIYLCLCMHSPQFFYGLSPGSPIYFVNTARNETQAKNVFFKEFRGHLENCKWFLGRHSEPGAMEVHFDKNIIALSVPSTAYGWLGYNTIQWVGDELAFFLEKSGGEELEDAEDNTSRAKECWESAYGSCQTRFPEHYKMVGITTPRYDDDFVMNKFNELESRMRLDGSAYVRQAATWDINPRTPMHKFKHKLETDRRRTMRDFGAIPVGVIESFFPDPDYLEDHVCEGCLKCPIYQSRKQNTSYRECYEYEDCTENAYMGNGQYRDWFKPDPEVMEYMGHIDLSTVRDRIGFTLGHVVDMIKVQIDPVDVLDRKDIALADITEDDLFVDKAIMKIDAIIFLSNRDKFDSELVLNGYFDYDKFLKLCIFQLVDLGFNITKITTDQFQSHYVRQMLDKKGIETDILSLDRNDEVPVSAKDAIVENRVLYPYSRLLCEESKYLKYIRGKKVDHAKKSSKDVWDGFAGAIYNIDNDAAGTFYSVMLEVEDED